MKKVISLFCLCMFFFSCLSYTSSAEEIVILNSSVEYLEDGSAIETIIFTEKSNSLTRSSAITGGKTIKYKGDDGKVEWSATLRATFTYNGTTASCNTASITYSISDSSWKITSATATKSGNKATGNVTAKRYALGILAKTVNRSVTLTCSATGTLS